MRFAYLFQRNGVIRQSLKFFTRRELDFFTVASYFVEDYDADVLVLVET